MTLAAQLLAGLCALQVPEPPAAATAAWQAPPACPDRAALTRAIDRRLGRPLADDEVRFAGAISQHPAAPRFRLRLELTAGGRSQTRTLTAERCASLVDATALLVVLALTHADPTVVPQDTTPEPAELAPADAPPGPAAASDDAGQWPYGPDAGDDPTRGPDVAAGDDPTRAPDAATSEERTLELRSPLAPPTPPRRLGAFVRVHGGPEYGAVPGATGAVGLASGLLWPRARLEVQGIFLAPRTATGADHTLRVALIAGAVLGCGRLGRGALEVPLCGGLELGGVRSTVTGPGARSGADVWLAGVLTAGLAWHVARRLSLTLALHGLVHLYGPRFELRDPGPSEALFRAQPVSGRLLVGLEVRLGDPW